MSDLSQLLGAVYDDGDSGPSPVSIGAPARQPAMATTAPASVSAIVTAIPAASPLAALNAALSPAAVLDPPTNEDAATGTPDVAVASAAEPRRADPPAGATTARSPFADALDAGPAHASPPTPPQSEPAPQRGLNAHGPAEAPPAGDKKNSKSNGKAKRVNETVDASLPHAPPEPPPVHDELRPWRREDDDILPARRRKRLFSRG